MRRSVPAVVSIEGSSDRQILMEAVQHIDQLTLEEFELKENILKLRIDNLTLKIGNEHSRTVQLSSSRENQLAIMMGAAEITAMQDELRKVQTQLVDLQLHRPIPLYRDMGDDISAPASPVSQSGQAMFNFSVDSSPEEADSSPAKPPQTSDSAECKCCVCFIAAYYLTYKMGLIATIASFASLIRVADLALLQDTSLNPDSE